MKKQKKTRGVKCPAKLHLSSHWFPQSYLKTAGEMSSQHNHSLKEGEWNRKCISLIIWFQASSWLTFINTEELRFILSDLDFYSHSRLTQPLELGFGFDSLETGDLVWSGLDFKDWATSLFCTLTEIRISWKMLPLTCILCLQWKGTHTINRWSLFHLIKADFNQT